jgi:spore cortex formation protein SpoVR/YcgB (stage V sporulation)
MCIEPDDEDRKWFPDICGSDWLDTIKYIVENYRDESFVLQFLSPKVCRHFKLFSAHIDEKETFIYVSGTHEDESFLHIRKTLAEQYDLSRSIPQIEIVKVDWETDRWLYLEHITKNNQRLDYENMKKTVQYINKLWGFPVKMEYKDLDGNDLDNV